MHDLAHAEARTHPHDDCVLSMQRTGDALDARLEHVGELDLDGVRALAADCGAAHSHSGNLAHVWHRSAMVRLAERERALLCNCAEDGCINIPTWTPIGVNPIGKRAAERAGTA